MAQKDKTKSQGPIIKEGYLNMLIQSPDMSDSWQKRYFVLRGQSVTCQPRLDFYMNKDETNKTLPSHKTIFIEEIQHLRQGSTIRDEKTPSSDSMFQITKSDKKHYRIAASSGEESREWVQAIQDRQHARLARPPGKQLAGAGGEKPRKHHNYAIPRVGSDGVDSFHVTAIPTETTRRCKISGEYMLAVGNQAVSLVDDSDHVMYSWPFKFIRRYGRSMDTFNFEAGRYCDSGEGLFSFSTQDGEKVFCSFRDRAMALKKSASIEKQDGHNTSSDDDTAKSPKSKQKPPIVKPKPKRSENDVYDDTSAGKLTMSDMRNIDAALKKLNSFDGDNDDDDNTYSQLNSGATTLTGEGDYYSITSNYQTAHLGIGLKPKPPPKHPKK